MPTVPTPAGGVRLPAAPPVLVWIAVMAGGWLITSALRGVSPAASLRSGLTGAPPPPRTPLLASFGDAPEQSVNADPTNSTAGFQGPGGADGPLVDLGGINAGKMLTAPAAVAFHAWEAGFGQPIPITGGWRSSAAQAAGHAKYPDRFAPAGESFHEKGRAVDVDNNWIGRLSPSQASRLRQTAKAAGWGQARYKRGEAGCGKAASGAAKDNDERWHFSFGGCG